MNALYCTIRSWMGWDSWREVQSGKKGETKMKSPGLLMNGAGNVNKARQGKASFGIVKWNYDGEKEMHTCTTYTRP
ncbi:hypothetical protein BPAE_0075g00060 [Botrytis paeoniae]|uniref:Uncharacterized protein n=1 Tax=Botrytis paeoniae TaxID=278948 RepID=A0A4Z1FVA6_9HELO|nr:hypothetical protein BPAE_0075g00060 [Botrytis paeoniae]